MKKIASFILGFLLFPYFTILYILKLNRDNEFTKWFFK